MSLSPFPDSTQASPRLLALFLGTCAIVLSAIGGLNYRVDPVGLFDNGEVATAAATYMLAGNGIAAINLDERNLHRAYAALTPQAPETLILGSSRAMQISTDMVGGSLYNGAANSATLLDLLAIAELFLVQEKLPKRILIVLDTWLLNATNRNERWRSLSASYASMLRRLNLPVNDAVPEGNAKKLRTLISLAYTMETITAIRADWREILRGRGDGVKPVSANDTAAKLRRPDGSLQYSIEYRNRDVERVRATALDHGRKLITESLRADTINEDQVDLLRVFIAFLQDQDVDMILMLPPLHPVTYKIAMDDGAGKYLHDIEFHYREISDQLGIPIIGSYDPQIAGCGDHEFLDGIHAKDSCRAKIVGSSTLRQVIP